MATYASELQRVMRRSLVLSVIMTVLLVVAAVLLLGAAVSSVTPDECKAENVALSYKCEQLLYP